MRLKRFIPPYGPDDDSFNRLAEHILHTVPTGRKLRKALRPFFMYEQPMPVDLEMYVGEVLGEDYNHDNQ